MTLQVLIGNPATELNRPLIQSTRSPFRSPTELGSLELPLAPWDGKESCLLTAQREQGQH